MSTAGDELGGWMLATDGGLAIIIGALFVLMLVTTAIGTIAGVAVTALLSHDDDDDAPRPSGIVTLS